MKRRWQFELRLRRRVAGGWHAALLLPALASAVMLALSSASSAQTDLRFLVFDAVPLSPPVEQGADAGPPQAGAPPYLTEELASLPRIGAESVEEALVSMARSNAGISENLSEADVERFEAQLQELERQGDSYAPALAETLLGLAAVYEGLGNYAAAVPLYDRASHITRVNAGLFSLEQEPIIRRLFNNYYMQGDLVAADQQQEYLFYLQRRNHGDDSPSLLPALGDYAAWNIQASRSEPIPPAAPPTAAAPAEGEEPAPSTTGVAEPPPDMVEFRLRHLMQAQAQYLHTLQLVALHFGPDDPRLPDIERSLAITNYLYTTQAVLLEGVSSQSLSGFDQPVQRLGFNEGRRSLERRIEYLQRRADSDPVAIAEARLDLVDWMIATRNRSNVREILRSAHQELKQAGASEQQLAALFNPPLPVALPGFLAEPFSREELGIPAEAALEYQGFIDVEFMLNAFGDTSSPKLLYGSENTPEEIIDILLRTIRRGQYRPRLQDGEIIGAEHIHARYYYAH